MFREILCEKTPFIYKLWGVVLKISVTKGKWNKSAGKIVKNTFRARQMIIMYLVFSMIDQ